MNGCAECLLGFDHCHGTLLVHVDGRVECTEAECADIDHVRHELVLDCAGTLPGCCARLPLALAV